jgi:hypothetical protein
MTGSDHDPKIKIGHDPKKILGHDLDPVMIPNTKFDKKNGLKRFSIFNLKNSKTIKKGQRLDFWQIIG